ATAVPRAAAAAAAAGGARTAKPAAVGQTSPKTVAPKAAAPATAAPKAPAPKTAAVAPKPAAKPKEQFAAADADVPEFEISTAPQEWNPDADSQPGKKK
ncbi:MAG: hypothetical protein WB799_13995, partial [Candidatus Sulfotelmatobacter sp.]